jgi:nucleotide-binding universal stress UspA family protein
MTTGRTKVQSTVKNILFATDFSPAADKAAVFLAGLAKHFSCRVQILHVLDLSGLFKAPDAGISIEICRKSAEEKLAATKADSAARGIEVEAILSEGLDPAEEILQVAEEKAADLIVVGTRGLSALGRVTLGSVAQHLIHESDRPVFTTGPNVKTLQPLRKFQRIVCATDFSADATNAIRFALPFTQSYDAHMFVCHVLPKPDASRPIDAQELNDKFRAQLQRLIPGIAREWCEPECVVDHGYAVDGILLVAKRVKADLIVLGTHRSSNWFSTFKAGIAYEVIRTAECPVLTIRG